MPDDWNVVSQAPAPAAAPTGDWGVVSNAPAQEPEDWLSQVGDTLATAASKAWKQVSTIVPGTAAAAQAGEGMVNLVRHPLASAEQYGQQNDQIKKQAVDAFKNGRYAEGFHRVLGYLANGIPGLGSAYNDAVSDAVDTSKPMSERVGGALGTPAGVAATMYAGAKLPNLVEGATSLPGKVINKLAPNVNNPVQESALQWAEDKGVPMSVGQRSGQTGLQRVEQGLENIPGAATPAREFYKGQQRALGATGRDVAQDISPTATNEYGAGQAVNQRLQQRIARLKGQGDNLYDQVRSDAAKNQQSVQVGQTASPIVGPTGQPITTPVMQTLDSPVALQPIRSQLKPMWDDINRLMPEARKSASPAYSALKDLMNSPDEQMSAMDFDKYLGAVKALARDGDSPYLTSRSQALANQIVAGGEQQLQTALTQVNPKLYAKLQSARNTVKAYYNTSDLLQDINNTNQEPGVLFDNITRGGDRVVDTLKQLQKVAPKELITVGRTFVEDLMNKATREGGFARSPGIMDSWDRLGPETKSLLFGPQAPEIDQFMLAAKALTANMNPSGSARMLASLHALGAGGAAMASMITGNPLPIAGFAAGVGGARAAANVLFSGGAKKVATALAPFSQRGLAVGTGLAAGSRSSQFNPDAPAPITSPEVQQ